MKTYRGCDVPDGTEKRVQVNFDCWMGRHDYAGCWGIYKHVTSPEYVLARRQAHIRRVKGVKADEDLLVPRGTPHEVRNAFYKFRAFHEQKPAFQEWLDQREGRAPKIFKVRRFIDRKVPEGVDKKTANRYYAYCSLHGGIPFEQWKKRKKKARITPVGCDPVIARKFYDFRAQYGRCTFKAWLAWATGKGPYPLKIL